jgi:biopolymer transport protein TolQ
MIDLLLLLAAAPVEVLPPEALAAATAPPEAGLNYIQLVLHASWPVLIVMVLLLVASVMSWFVIFRKMGVFSRAQRAADDFEGRFWSGSEITALYRAATDRNRGVTGMEAIFEAGYREFARLRQQHRDVDARGRLESAQRAMRATLAREVDRLEHNLELLANVGSTAPYVGLVGTVFGIMISFHGLANNKQATIASVAPGISEALIATAMGLFAAIPAVWAYNRFATRVERLSVRYESFAEEFSSILQRQTHIDEP